MNEELVRFEFIVAQFDISILLDHLQLGDVGDLGLFDSFELLQIPAYLFLELRNVLLLLPRFFDVG